MCVISPSLHRFTAGFFFDISEKGRKDLHKCIGLLLFSAVTWIALLRRPLGHPRSGFFLETLFIIELFHFTSLFFPCYRSIQLSHDLFQIRRDDWKHTRARSGEKTPSVDSSVPGTLRKSQSVNKELRDNVKNGREAFPN